MSLKTISFFFFYQSIYSTQVSLKESVSELNGGLDAVMTEGETNLSVGQRKTQQ